LLFRGKGCRKRDFKNRFQYKNILIKSLNNLWVIFLKIVLVKQKVTLKKKLKKMTGPGLGLKRKHKLKRASQSKCRGVK